MRKAFALVILIAFSMLTMLVPQVSASVVELDLYAGVSGPAEVYKYAGGPWTRIGTFADDYAVLCLVKYQCDLYAGTMSTDDPHDGIGRVYRYDGDTTWTLVGDDMDDQVACLVVYHGNLYAGTAWGQGRLYRYDGDTTWTLVVDVTTTELDAWDGFRSAYVWGDLLYLGGILHQNIGHYDGITFTHDAYMGYCEGIYDYEVYGECLYAAGGEGGTLHGSPDGTNWNTVWYRTTYSAGNAWELEPFQGYLYMGLGNGTLVRSDGSSLSNVWNTPDGQGIISMMVAPGLNKLFLGVGGEAGAYYGSSTSGEGKIYTYDGTSFQRLHEGILGNGIQVLYATPTLPAGVIPEVPLGTIMISAAMIIALVAYVAVPRWRRKQI